MQAQNALDAEIYPHYIQIMRDQNFSMRVSEEFRQHLDTLRRAEPDLPSQTEMVHRLVEKAVKTLKSKPNPRRSR